MTSTPIRRINYKTYTVYLLAYYKEHKIKAYVKNLKAEIKLIEEELEFRKNSPKKNKV